MPGRLLAIVPLFVVLLVGLSHVVDEHRLLDTVAPNLQLVIPSQAAAVTEQVESFWTTARLHPETGMDRACQRGSCRTVPS